MSTDDTNATRRGSESNDLLGVVAAASKMRRTKPWWRYTLRAAIDMAAIYCAWAIQFAASGSLAAAFITAAAVGAYGYWCFYDGHA